MIKSAVNRKKTPGRLDPWEKEGTRGLPTDSAEIVIGYTEKPCVPLRTAICVGPAGSVFCLSGGYPCEGTIKSNQPPMHERSKIVLHIENL